MVGLLGVFFRCHFKVPDTAARFRNVGVFLILYNIATSRTPKAIRDLEASLSNRLKRLIKVFKIRHFKRWLVVQRAHVGRQIRQHL